MECKTTRGGNRSFFETLSRGTNHNTCGASEALCGRVIHQKQIVILNGLRVAGGRTRRPGTISRKKVLEDIMENGCLTGNPEGRVGGSA